MAKMLSVADVATMRGIGRVAAWRWLKRNAGSYVVYDGRFPMISERDYLRVNGPAFRARIEQRLADLESTTREQTRRLDRHAEALRKVNLL